MSEKTFQLPAIEKADTQQFVDADNNHTLLRYFQNIERQFKYAHNIGVAIDDNDQAEDGTKAVYLRDLFVRPNLSQYHISPEQMLSKANDKLLNIADLLAEHQRLFVLGDAGMGKSTLISSLMLAFSYYTDNLTKIALGKRVPFALILRDLDLKAVTDWQSLWQAFLDHNKTFTEPLNDEATIQQVFDSGQALIMLDGLDEITHSAQRHQLADALLEAMHLYPRCLFMISSRIIGFNQAEWFGLPPVEEVVNVYEELDGLKMVKAQQKPRDVLPSFYLAPFDESQISQFVRQWYRLYVPKQVNHEQRISDLLGCLKNQDGLKVLARIPVMLNMICFIHARRARLPNGRAELYQRIAETYLISLDKARGLQFKAEELSFDYHDFSAWLADIAYTLQQKRTEQDSHLLMLESDVQALLNKALADYGCSEPQIAQQTDFVIQYFAERTGLFIPRGLNNNGKEQYGFAHLSFLEYFAAYWLKLQAPVFEAKEWTQLRKKTQYVWWHETFALFFESLDNAKLTEKCLNKLFSTKTALQSDAQQNLCADIVMDNSVRLPMPTRKQYIARLADIYLKRKPWWVKEHLAARLCSEYCEAITHLTGLTDINFEGTDFNHFTLLAQLPQLQGLWLNNTAITDLSPLAQLPQLQRLGLNNTAITDLSPLAQLPQLQWLGLNNTAITDLSPLAQLTQLQMLMLSNTAITDLSPLAQLPQLRELWLNNTAITDLSPLANLAELNMLFIEGVKTNADALKKQLPKLEIIQ